MYRYFGCIKTRLLIRIITILFLVLAANAAIACLNGESKTLKDGSYIYEDREGNVPYGHEFMYDNYVDIIKQLDSLYKATKDIEYLSDKGLVLILQRNYAKAIQLYLDIERTFPNRYSTASNIGTAYELDGQNENALQWIKKAVAIDPASHKNSEWIHVKILEAKIKGQSFYTSSFLLNNEFGNEARPVSTLSRQELQRLSDGLYYQLNERVSFVEPKEKIVAQLLFELGNIAFLLDNFQDAVEDYQQAKVYGFTGQLIENRQVEAARLSKSPWAPGKPGYRLFALYALGAIILVILAITIYKRRRTFIEKPVNH